MTGPDQPEDASATDEVAPGDREATWLITTPPPPPPPLGAQLSRPEPPRIASPPPPLPTASTPPVNAPPDEAAAAETPARPPPPGAPPPAPGSSANETVQLLDATTGLVASGGTDAAAPHGDAAAPGPGSPPPDWLPPDATPPGAAAAAGAAGAAAADGPENHTAHRHPLAGGSAAAKSVLHEVSEISAWMLASAAILVAFFVAWFAGIILSFRHSAGLTARDRILQFFAPGTLGWAVAVLVAIALYEVGRRSDPMLPADPADPVSGARLRKKRLAELLPYGLLLAGAGVTVSALVGVLVELTNFGNGIDAAFSSLISYLALVVVGAAATWLAFREMGKTAP